MQTFSTWLRTYRCTPSLDADIRARLGAAGVQIVDPEESQFGLVCFTEMTEELLSLIQQHAGEGRSRLAPSRCRCRGRVAVG
jgi:hypothetical protein